MNDQPTQPTARAEGFYWVSSTLRRKPDSPCIARWSEPYGSSPGAWWFCGDEVEADDEDVMVLSRRLQEPS